MARRKKNVEPAAKISPASSTTISAGEFKARCLALMDVVRERGVEYVVTKRGKPVAKLVPVKEEKPPQLFGALKGSMTFVGDIVSPMNELWDELEEGLDRGWDDE